MTAAETTMKKLTNEKKHQLVTYFAAAFIVVFLVLVIALPHQCSVRCSMYKGGDAVSIQGIFGGKTVSGENDTLVIPAEISQEDKLIITRTMDEYRLVTYAGRFWAGNLTGNAQDGEYYSRITLDAFEESTRIEHPENPYFKDMTIPELLSEYSEHLIIFALKGGSTNGWTNEMQSAFSAAGIKMSLRVNDDGGMAGYIYRDRAQIYKKTDIAVSEEEVAGHEVRIVSAGVSSGNTASIMIDDNEYSPDANGLNIVVYDPENDRLIDSVSYNVNTSDPVMTRADDLFYTWYVTEYNHHLPEYVQASARVTEQVIRVVSILLIFLLLFVMRQILKIREKLTVKKLLVQQIPLLAGLLVLALAREGYTYLNSHFKGVTFAQLLFHLNTNLNGVNWNGFSELYRKFAVGALMIIPAAAAAFGLQCLAVRRLNKKSRLLTNIAVRIIQWAAMALCLSLIWAQCREFWVNYHVNDYLTAEQFECELYETVYTAPEQTEITFPEQKKNLIYIFMESMETTVADEVSGGGKSFNAIPELSNLAMEYDCFNGEENTLNGALPLYNSTWTIAGMVAQSSGMPLAINHYFSNSKGIIQSFLPGMVTLGDILEKEGYRNAVMMGSDASFGNRDQYYSEHGNYDIYDYTWAKKTGRIPEGYKVFWGFEDAKLFEMAKQQAEEMAYDEGPFSLTLLTVDTHFPKGYHCEDCDDELPDQYSNAFHCSSRKVSEFVSWVQEQEWGKDTVIVLNGDHLCMSADYFDDIPGTYERLTYTTVINSAKEEPQQKRLFSTMDLFPTTLSAMGCEIEGDRLGLGTDLYSDRETLLEEKGINYLNYQLSLNSEFYDQHFMEIE